MSIQFNNTTTLKGLAQFYAEEIGGNKEDVANWTDSQKKVFASSCNLAFDSFWAIAIPASGKWQLDDSNQTDYPIITTNLVSGQRDYSFTTDGSSNLILDIYRVMVANSAGYFTEVLPVDQQSDLDVSSFYDGQNTGGIPTRYDKTANGIFFDLVPNWSRTGGLKVFINREASYFVYGDTTKKPGVPGIFHKYFYLLPALDYARRNSLASYNKLKQDVMEMENAIKTHFAGRD